MRPDDIMNIGQRAATEQDSIENELIAENNRLRNELRILRDVVPLYEELRGAVISEPLSKRGHLRVNDAVQRLNAALEALEED